MPFSVRYRPSFSISLPFGVTIGFELPPPELPELEGTRLTDARLLRIQRLANDVTSALELDDLPQAIARLLALADEFPASERREAVLLSHRVTSLHKARHALSGDLWSQRAAQLAGEIVDAVAIYQGTADLAWSASHDSPPRRQVSFDGQARLAPDTEDVRLPASSTSSKCVVKCEDVGWHVDGRWILRDVSFELMGGSVVGIVGPNGAGKTSLLRLLAQDLAASHGQVSYPGLAAPGYSARRIRDRIAYVPQIPTPYYGYLEPNLRRFAALRGLRDQSLDDEVSFVVERFQLEAYRLTPWPALSGGFRTRVELARSVLASPDIIILDEPLGPLDRQAEREYLRHLRDLAESRRQACVILTSQDIHAVSAIADHIIVLKNGRARFAGPPADIEEALPQRSYEFAGDLPMRALTKIFASLPDATQLQDLGSTRLLVTPISVSARDVIELLLAGGESVQYFRDLSSSPQQILEEDD